MVPGNDRQAQIGLLRFARDHGHLSQRWFSRAGSVVGDEILPPDLPDSLKQPYGQLTGHSAHNPSCRVTCGLLWKGWQELKYDGALVPAENQSGVTVGVSARGRERLAKLSTPRRYWLSKNWFAVAIAGIAAVPGVADLAIRFVSWLG